MFLLNKFPRELCKDNIRIKIAHNLNDVVSFINQYNGYFNLYTTVYMSMNTNGQKTLYYNDVIVDKIFIDIDFKNNNIINDVRQLANYLITKKKLKFSVNFSGRGFHFFIYSNNYLKPDKKEKLKQIQRELISHAGLELSKNVDRSSFGDLAREVRLINTINLKSGLFCIPLL